MRKIQDDLKARTAELHDIEESNRKLANEKTSLEEKLSRLQKKNADEVRIPIFFILTTLGVLVDLKTVAVLQMQISIVEGNFEQERRSLKLRVAELERKLEEVTRNLVAAQSAIALKDTEISALQNNLRELEELREMKEVEYICYHSFFFSIVGLIICA